MTPTRVALGVVCVNGILVVVGFCLLSVLLRGRSFVSWLSYAGVALLVGAAATLVALCCSAVAGARINPTLFLLEAALLSVVGLAAGLAGPRGRRAAAPPERGAWATSLFGDLVATVSCFFVVVVLAFGLVGGLRTSPWLDDVWGFWVPKGILLDRIGLHADLLLRTRTLTGFTNPSYPFLWSILSELDLRFAGALDLRVVNFQEAILVVAFVAAVARLLSTHVRAAILWPSLLLFVASPALFRQAQSGEADLPLACFVGLFVVGALLWLRYGDRVALAASFAGAAAALATKNEGLPLGSTVLVVLTVFAFAQQRRRLLVLWVAAVVAYGTAFPWFHWRAVHSATYDVTLRMLLSPGRLSDRSAQGRRAVQQVVHWSTTPREWLLLVPLVLLAAVVGIVLTRRPVWLLPALLVLAPAAMLAWVLWTEPQNAVSTSYLTYRLVTPVLFVAAVLLPCVAELLLQARAGRRPH